MKKLNNIKVWRELSRLPLYMNNQKKMPKFCQQFPFIDKKRYLHKAFQGTNTGRRVGKKS